MYITDWLGTSQVQSPEMSHTKFEVFRCNITETSHHCPHLLICAPSQVLYLNHAVRLQYVSINTLQGP